MDQAALPQREMLDHLNRELERARLIRSGITNLQRAPSRIRARVARILHDLSGGSYRLLGSGTEKVVFDIGAHRVARVGSINARAGGRYRIWQGQHPLLDRPFMVLHAGTGSQRFRVEVMPRFAEIASDEQARATRAILSMHWPESSIGNPVTRVLRQLRLSPQTRSEVWDCSGDNVLLGDDGSIHAHDVLVVPPGRSSHDDPARIRRFRRALVD